jgi:hypothetical protein
MCAFDMGKIEKIGGDKVKQIKVRDGIETELA